MDSTDNYLQISIICQNNLSVIVKNPEIGKISFRLLNGSKIQAQVSCERFYQRGKDKVKLEKRLKDMLLARKMEEWKKYSNRS